MSPIVNNENLRITPVVEIRFSWPFFTAYGRLLYYYMHIQKQHLEIIIAISGNAKQRQNSFFLGRSIVLVAQEENIVINCKI